MSSPELNTETRDFNQQPSQFSFSQVSEDGRDRGAQEDADGAGERRHSGVGAAGDDDPPRAGD